jgi:hypothetical protein
MSWKRGKPGQSAGDAAPIHGVKLHGDAVHKSCFPCYAPAQDRDFVFTRYTP